MFRIQIEDLHYAYLAGINALNGISLTIEAGEKAALVGENGSGKSTLARHINGLLKAGRGKVWVGDWDAGHCSPAKMAQRVAYAFQNPDDQLFHQQVWGEVAFGPRNLGWPADQVEYWVKTALELFGLSETAHANPRDLNYSARKRTALASAVAMAAGVLILDEPTAGLDSREQEQLGQVISLLHGQGKTILVISHDLDFLAEHFDRFILLQHGKVVLDADFQSFFAQTELLEQAGLLTPQMVRLSQRMEFSRLAASPNQFVDFLEGK